MADETPETGTPDDTPTESVDEWKAEAEKWKEQASEHEKAAKENAEAARRVEELEGSAQQSDDEHAEALLAAATESEQAVADAKAEGDKTLDEWKTEAEKWKALSRKNEDQAKKNLAAAKRLEKLEAEGQTKEEQAAETTADLEAKATESEAKALRYEVAQEMGVPKELMALLSGSSKKEIEEQAERLLVTLEREKPPEPEPTEGEDEELAKERSELEEAQKRAAEAEAKALRYEVAAEKQLPAGVADLLTASTREDLVRQADALLSAIGVKDVDETSTRARMPQRRLRPGAVPDSSTEADLDPGATADAVLRRNRGY